MSSLPTYLSVHTPHDQPPGPGITVNVSLELRTVRQVFAFAFDMARGVSVAAWWHRVAVFVGLLAYGFGLLISRPA